MAVNRRHISTRERARLFAAHNGICALCGGKIDAAREGWDLDHGLALGLTGADEADNLRPVHAKCHKAKTADDVGRMRKADRAKAIATGAKAPSRTPIPGGRGSKWKRTINRGTVLR